VVIHRQVIGESGHGNTLIGNQGIVIQQRGMGESGHTNTATWNMVFTVQSNDSPVKSLTSTLESVSSETSAFILVPSLRSFSPPSVDSAPAVLSFTVNVDFSNFCFASDSSPTASLAFVSTTLETASLDFTLVGS